jgi:Do/DeqQ family serine protease
MNAIRSDMTRRRVNTALAVVAAALLVAGVSWHGSAAAQQPARTVSTPITHAIAGGRDSYADIVDVVAPAVVTIRVSGKARVSPTQFQGPDDDLLRRFFGDQFGERGQRQAPRTFRQRGLGSGVVVTTDGYILTNYHVVDGADEISVDLTDGRTFTGKVVGTDKPSDLALLKVSASNLHAVAFGNSDGVKVGDVVLAVGNPLGVGQTVTMGIISAKSRSTQVGDGSYEDFLQTDAPINHGNSGGALVNTKGELVGINSQILSNSDGNIGIGFAIPANMAKHVMEDLRTKGKVTRAQLGVTVQQVTPDLAASLGLKETAGVVVSDVTAGSAAEHAGIKRGDVIKSFNGQGVHDTNSLRNRVADAGVGSTADVVIVRDGAERHLTARLDEASLERLARRGGGERDDQDSNEKTALGISVAPLTGELADRLRAPKNVQGLYVQDVDPDGRAADAGIQQGDVIQEANRQPLKSVDDLRAAARRSTDKPLLLLVNRQGRDLFVTVKPANG